MGMVDAAFGGPDQILEATPETLTRDEANMLLWRRERLIDQAEEADQVYRAAFQRLADAREAHIRSLQSGIADLDRALTLWHHARWLEDPKANISIMLPFGTLTSTKAQDEWVYDEPAFLAWAKVNAQGAVIPPTPQPPRLGKREARQLLADHVTVREAGTVVHTVTGEVVPGLRITKGGTFQLGRHYKIQEAS